jgi:hypothetical protein
MDITHLVCIHETGIAHHIATIRQIDCEDCAAAVLDVGVAVLVDVVIVRTLEVTFKKQSFDTPGEIGTGRENVFKGSMLLAMLPHQHATVFFDDLRLQLAGTFGNDRLQVRLPADDLAANFRDATRA